MRRLTSYTGSRWRFSTEKRGLRRRFLRDAVKKIQTARTEDEAPVDAMGLISFDWGLKARLVTQLPAKRLSGPLNYR
jgi:hypothetical protein